MGCVASHSFIFRHRFCWLLSLRNTLPPQFIPYPWLSINVKLPSITFILIWRKEKSEKCPLPLLPISITAFPFFFTPY